MVRDLLTAEGQQDENGAVTYFLANNTVDKMTDDVRPRCSSACSSSAPSATTIPFTDWKQTEYWGMADFFMKVQLTGPQQGRQAGRCAGRRRNRRPPRAGKTPLPDSAKIVPAKFLGGPKRTSGVQGRRSARVLAEWMTTADNPYFSKAMVNRVWFQLFGRGLVNPVDDLNNDQNPASHPQLLVDLADQFARSGFDLKDLFRAICNSQAYQRTSKPTADNADADPALYARMAVKVMTPEQLFDSLSPGAGPERGPAHLHAGQTGQGRTCRSWPGCRRLTARSLFVLFFEAEDASDPTEYQDGIPQALRLMNGPQLNNAAAAESASSSAASTPEENIDRLFLAALSRRPTAQEREHMTAYLAKHKTEAHEGYGDVLWVLLNCSEFVLNH